MLCGLALALASAVAQQAPPTETKGVTLKPLTAVDLGLRSKAWTNANCACVW